MFKLTKYFVRVELPIDGAAQSILYSLRTGASFIFQTQSFKNLETGRYDLLNDDEILKLIESKVLILSEENEIDSILQFNSGSNEVNTELSFTIQPTSNCQLGCFYCGQEHKKDKISSEVIAKTVDRIAFIVNQKEKVDKLHITWYGGEPLMATTAIEQYSLKLMELCRNKGISYSADMITNGLLLNEKTILQMLNLNIKAFQVTIDGTQKTHDMRRVTKGGAGTFDLIFKNILNFVKSDYYERYNAQLTLRINIDKTMVEEVDKLIDMVYNEGILDKITISFAPVFDWGGNQANKNSLTHTQFAEKEIEWLFKLHQLGVKDLDLIPQVSTASCMVDSKDSEVYDAYGNIMACYEYTYTPAYNSDNFIEGNVLVSTQYANKTAIRNWQEEVKLKTYSNCIECKFYPVCSGECPKQWMNGHVPCPSYKFNIEDRLLIQYLNTHQ